MNTFKIKLKLNSSLITPLMGDTMFGFICWGIYYHEGEPDLKAFLDNYKSNPFIISEGFPEDTLPRPLLYPEKHKTNLSLEELNTRKIIKKISHVPSTFILNNSNMPLSETKLIDMLIENKSKVEKLMRLNMARMHNTINRLTNTVEENALYTVNEMWFPGVNVFDVYVVTGCTKERVLQLFEWGFENGYGADKSTGKGNMNIESIEETAFHDNGNKAMALGSFIPAEDEQLQRLRAFVISKFGKLGGHFANSMNPFKKPFIIYAAGATFDAENVNKPFIGRLLDNVHNDTRIRHHAYAPIIRFNAEEV